MLKHTLAPKPVLTSRVVCNTHLKIRVCASVFENVTVKFFTSVPVKTASEPKRYTYRGKWTTLKLLQLYKAIPKSSSVKSNHKMKFPPKPTLSCYPLDNIIRTSLCYCNYGLSGKFSYAIFFSKIKNYFYLISQTNLVPRKFTFRIFFHGNFQFKYKVSF